MVVLGHDSAIGLKMRYGVVLHDVFAAPDLPRGDHDHLFQQFLAHSDDMFPQTTDSVRSPFNAE